jgi:endonuclease/exonuclease/phosphatase (EEP) superfamily protein YafD
LVTLEELSNANESSLLATGAVAGYRYRYVKPANDSTGFGVWSDQPLSSSITWSAYGHPEYSGVLTPPQGPAISLLVVHTFAPYGASEPGDWIREIAAIRSRISSLRHPALIAGDFNATDDMKQFRPILRADFTDAAVASGEGWRMTWPRNKWWTPTVVRPDHVLYSAGLTVTSYRLGHGVGSDHRPLELSIARSG